MELNSFPSEFFPNGWHFESYEENPDFSTSNPSFLGLSNHTEFSFESYPFVDGFTVPFPAQDDYPLMVEDEELSGFLGSAHQHYPCLEERKMSCKVEMQQGSDIPPFKKAKKLEGQPSKNLMAERRRRKRLNDRLSMLRSIVPKISKMDRTSILGDTIDYVKELLERINNLQEEASKNGKNLEGILKQLKPNEIQIRNAPKFHVERKEMDTQIDICCAAKPGLLLSTVNTIEALGLEIQQCVISCFNDFSMQATCSEVVDQRTVIGCEEMKQTFFRNAGYGGKCL